METVSENQDRSKRGRPKLLNDAQVSVLRFATDAKTVRHQQNVHYQMKALSALMDDERFLWVCDKQAMMEGRLHSYRPTILAELGRIDDEELLRCVALQICKLKPKTREAVAIIRRWRLNKPVKGDALQLANEIIGTINDYFNRYPEMTMEQIQDALRTASAQADKGMQ